MNFKAMVGSWLVFVGVGAHAETHFLLVDMGTSKNSNYYAFYNDIRQAYEILKALNRNVSVAAKGGSWILTNQSDEILSTFSLTTEGKTNPPAGNSPSYPPISSPSRAASDLADAI